MNTYIKRRGIESLKTKIPECDKFTYEFFQTLKKYSNILKLIQKLNRTQSHCKVPRQ